MRPWEAVPPEQRYAHLYADKHGQLLLVEILQERRSGRVQGRFRCDCGSEIVRQITYVATGKATHCGCATDRCTPHIIHGMNKTREHQAWVSMKRRCLDPNTKSYARYGGRGICIHPEWINSFGAFFEALGPAPASHTLDRINNQLGYVPGNVRWATRMEQSRNRSNTYFWHIKGLVFQSDSEAAAHFGEAKSTIRRWALGRVNRSGSRTAPKENCYVVPKY